MMFFLDMVIIEPRLDFWLSSSPSATLQLSTTGSSSESHLKGLETWSSTSYKNVHQHCWWNKSFYRQRKASPPPPFTVIEAEGNICVPRNEEWNIGYCSMRGCFSNLHRVLNSIPGSVKQTKVYNNKLADKYKNFCQSFKMFF